MPTIKVTDERGSDVVKLDLTPGQGLGRYIRSGASLRSLIPIGRALDKPLTDVPNALREFGLELDGDVPVGSAAELSIVAGTHASVGVVPAGEDLFGGANLQAPLTVPNGSTYVSFGLGAMLNAGVQASAGRLSFGFEVGTAFEYGYHHRFDTAAQVPTLKNAVAETLRAATIPADAADLASLPVGDVVSLAGEGEIAFSGAASMSAVTNLLATPGLPIVGAASVAQTASVTVEAEWRASGEFELRVTRPAGNRVELSFYRRAGRALTVSAKAIAGVSANIRNNDLISTLIKAVSPDPEADLLALVNAELTDEQIATIQQAVAASVDRSLSASAQLTFSSLKQHEALFAYEIDVDALDDDARKAVGDALHGRLTPLDRLARAGARGVKAGRHATAHLSERRATWRLNLFGIHNAASLATFIKEGTLSYDPASGALNASDRITSTKILVKTRPLESDTEKVRKIMFESLMVTAAYQASQAIPASVAISASHSYVEQHQRTRREEIVNHYRALIALSLCDEAERDARLGAESDFGQSTFLIECAFDRAASDALFLDGGGRAQPVDHFERIARAALLALLPADDPARSFRRLPLERDAVWTRLKAAGPANMRSELPPHIADSELRLGLVKGDYLTVVWWADAMHRAGEALLEMRQFLAGRDAASLKDSKEFKTARKKLEGALAAVVANSKARFGDPWEVVALDTAAGRAGTVRAVIVSPKLAVSYDDAQPVEAAPAATRSMRGPGPALAASRTSGEPRQWTDAERAILDRHVINLRGGKLSTGGVFASSDEQLQRIFTDVLPKEIRARSNAGEQLRLVFYAHGGLTDELEGLLPVLARERFWRLNGIYPISFVWETGLREILRDVIGGAARAAPSRAGVSDLAIERAARQPGRFIWSRMKKSAEAASAKNGGAQAVARLTSALWAAHPGAIQIHAVGHSAGAIFNAHFLPALLAQKLPAGAPPLTVESLHFLAPAITNEAFKQTLKPLIGPGQPIRELTMYTMTEELEQRDESARPYGKSLLYLVNRAFEDEASTPILGMHESLRTDVPLIRFFGLAGREQVADVVFSRSGASAGLSKRSESITHGGFDNDVATMTSIVRRVLGVPDTVAVTDYFEDPIEGRDRATIVARPPSGVSAPVGGARHAGAPAVRRAVSRKPWSVLVWMAGDNNLESFGDRDLAEMKRVGSTDDVHVVTQFDSMRDDRTRRYHLQRHTASPDEDIVEELGETNTGDPAVAADFFTWAIERFPSDRVLAVVWNHGSGIDDTDIYAGVVPGAPAAAGRGAAPGASTATVRAAMTSRHRRALFRTTIEQAVNDRAIAFDDSSRDFLDNVELKKVLADVTRQTGRTIDLLGFDACLMNMVEVAYQLRTTAQCVVGSEEIEPGDGWPYDRVLMALAARPTMTARDLGKEIVDAYVASYHTEAVTQSVLDLTAVEDAATKVDALAKALSKAIRTPEEYVAVSKALNATQRFKTADFVDLVHFCEELGTRTKASAVKTATAQVIAAVTGANGFVAAERHKGTGVAGARGVAVYFPRGPVNKVYGKLDFAKSTAWSDFLEAFHTT